MYRYTPLIVALVIGATAGIWALNALAAASYWTLGFASAIVLSCIGLAMFLLVISGGRFGYFDED